MDADTEERIAGLGNMPPLVGQRVHAADPGLKRYFAREGVPALSHAFAGKIAVHPGLGGRMLAKGEMKSHMDGLLDRERTGKTVAYIHVPFCRSHCLYCGFYTKAWREDESSRYTDALIAELELWRGRKALQGAPVHAVYIGGGTPTELHAQDMLRLLKAVHNILPLANDCEITVEGRLSNFDERKMEACFEGGANRFSLGVQTFHTDIRQKMGRFGSREDMIRGLEKLLSYDQAAIIVDLIYGFPGQDMSRWQEDLEVATSLKLDGADCYQLNVYRQTPLGKAIERGDLPPAADIPQQSAMFAKAVEFLDKTFYRRVTMSHWARTSRERNLYNQYVKGPAHCLAFGPGAGGNLHGHFFVNRSDYRGWLDGIAAGEKPYAMMFQPQKRYYLYKAIAEGMERGGLDFVDIERTHGVAVDQTCTPVLEQWRGSGLVELEDRRLVLTLAGQFWQVNLSQLLQEYLKTQLEKNANETA